MKPKAAPRTTGTEINQILNGRADHYSITGKLRMVIEEIINNIENYCTGPTGCNFNAEMIRLWTDTPTLGEIMGSHSLTVKERELIRYVIYGKENVN